ACTPLLRLIDLLEEFVSDHADRCQLLERQDCFSFSGSRNPFLEPLVGGRFDTCSEPGSHLDTLRPQGKGGKHRPSVSNSAGGDDGNSNRIGNHWYEDKRSRLLPTVVASCLEAFGNYRVDSRKFRLFSKLHTGDNMNNRHPL